MRKTEGRARRGKGEASRTGWRRSEVREALGGEVRGRLPRHSRAPAAVMRAQDGARRRPRPTGAGSSSEESAARRPRAAVKGGEEEADAEAMEVTSDEGDGSDGEAAAATTARRPSRRPCRWPSGRRWPRSS